METIKVNLNVVKITTYDDEYGVWKTKMTDNILVDERNEESYFGSDEIFREYEDYLRDYNEQLKKYGSRFEWQKPRLDIDWVANIDNADDLATMKRILKIDTESKYLQTIYSKVQHYGGGEEGGWYYHTMEATTYTEDDVEVDTDRYDEGYVKYNEFYFGEYENLERQFYQ